MFLSDGMIVFNLNGKDWVIKDAVASFSDLTGIGGGQTITISASVAVDTNTFKTVGLNIRDTEIKALVYAFSTSGTGSDINIDEGKTTITGTRYQTVNPDNSTSGAGKINLSIFDKSTDKISGSFSGEIFKSSYTDTSDTEWSKTSIKSGRFNNIPLIIGK